MNRILVIDDEAEVRQLLCDILDDADCETVEAANGLEGLSRADKDHFCVVICDIMMPEMDGVETIMEVRRRWPAMKIVAISGGGHTRNLKCLQMARELGADRIIRKPFEPVEVLETVRALLRNGP